jgi:hypothetical protein
MRLDAAALDRLYWWSAYASLGIAQWFDWHKRDPVMVAAFLTDFYAALNQRANPHAPR